MAEEIVGLCSAIFFKHKGGHQVPFWISRILLTSGASFCQQLDLLPQAKLFLASPGLILKGN